jgi:hypothetical protein
MGMRSEIYVAFEMANGQKKITARYFDWNFEERMISRVRYTAEWLSRRMHSCASVSKNDLIPIIETNFDMVDHMQSAKIEPATFKPFKLHVKANDFLDDGRAFIYVNLKGEVKYCFTNNRELVPMDCDNYMIFDTECNYDYAQWKNPEYKNSKKMSKCRRNIKWLSSHAEVMTQEELDEFLAAEYVA